MSGLPTAETEVESQDDPGFQRISLGEIDPARSRHMWTRSAVDIDGDQVVVGQWDGTITAFETDSLEARWTSSHPDHVVGVAHFEGIETLGDGNETGKQVAVAGRGESGTIAAYDADSGDRHWSYETAADIGEPTSDRMFELPYVVCLEPAAPDSELAVYAAARRYERDGDRRRWHSTIYAFAPDGTVRWRYETDASPIALDLDDRGERLAVGYNRCPGAADTGLVVLEADIGSPLWTWDPGTEGERRVGDVAFDGDTLAVSSHGDKRGYLLGPRGAERWIVDLAVETEIGGELLYAYPNHTYANDGKFAFVTGNTYAADRRETESRHPNEHRIAVFDDGTLTWEASVGGFVHGLAADSETVVTPCAQNFRVRDPETHAVRRFDLESGPTETVPFEGVVTAAAIDGGRVAVIEEPVAYHDDCVVRGEHALSVGSLE